MAFATPYIEERILSYSIGTEWYVLDIESQDWQEWLNERGRIFRFEGELLKYTARLEQREKKQYWYAYCNYHKKVYKIYLGKSEELTFVRLQEASAELYRRCTSKKTEEIPAPVDTISEIPQSYKQEEGFQKDGEQTLDVDISRKGENMSTNVETLYPFSSMTNNDSLFFAPPEEPLEEPLTERERQILHYLIDGFSNKEIAQQLVLSPGTVKWHLRNLYSKLSVHTRSQAIARARALGL